MQDARICWLLWLLFTYSGCRTYSQASPGLLNACITVRDEFGSRQLSVSRSWTIVFSFYLILKTNLVPWKFWRWTRSTALPLRRQLANSIKSKQNEANQNKNAMIIKVYAMMSIDVIIHEYCSSVGPLSVAQRFTPQGFFQARRSVVLHRLMDREALMLFIWWFKELPLVVGWFGALLITFRCQSRLANLMARRGRGYELRFRLSGVSDQIISIQWLSFCLRYSLSSLWILSVAVTFNHP